MSACRVDPARQRLRGVGSNLIRLCLLSFLLAPALLWARCEPLPLSPAAVRGQLDYSERPPSPENPAAPILIGLHGLGHHKRGFSGLARRLPRTWRLIWVDAPFLYGRGFSWYRYRCAEGAVDLKRSTALLIQLARHLRIAYPASPKLGLFGFSQGGVMTLSALDEAPALWVAGASLAGYWLPQRPPQQRLSEISSLPSLLVFHGSGDQRVPLARGERAAQLRDLFGLELSSFQAHDRACSTSDAAQAKDDAQYDSRQHRRLRAAASSDSRLTLVQECRNARRRHRRSR